MKTKATRGKIPPGKSGTLYTANIARMERYLNQTRTEYVNRAKRADAEPGGTLAGPTTRSRTSR